MPIEKSEKHKTDNNKRILVAGDVLGQFTKFYQRLKVTFHPCSLFSLLSPLSSHQCSIPLSLSLPASDRASNCQSNPNHQHTKHRT